MQRVFVDESFIGSKTFIYAVEISEESIKQAVAEIKKVLRKHKNYKFPELKANIINKEYPESTIRKIKKIIHRKSIWYKIYEKDQCKQNTSEFFNFYSETLKDISKHNKQHNIQREVVVDKMGHHKKIIGWESYSFIHSRVEKGLQISDLISLFRT